MQLESVKPELSLQDHFKEYYFIQLDAGEERKIIPVIDDCSYDFVFYKEANANMSYGIPPKNLACNSSFFTIHNLTPPYKISFENTLTFFTIKLQPWNNGYFFSELTKNGIIDLSQIQRFQNLYATNIFDVSTSKEKFNLINNYFLQNPIFLNSKRKLVKQICELIIDKNGLISVVELSDYFLKSRQYLNKVFKEEVLYSLKKYITSVRILHLINYRKKHPEISLTEVSYMYNYFDQAHFIKDFKNICGVKPSYFFEHLPEFFLRHK